MLVRGRYSETYIVYTIQLPKQAISTLVVRPVSPEVAPKPTARPDTSEVTHIDWLSMVVMFSAKYRVTQIFPQLKQAGCIVVTVK